VITAGTNFEMAIKAVGIAKVAAGIGPSRRGPYRVIPDFMTELLRLAEEVCDQVEATTTSH
jgi:hypothetical protein